MDRNYQLAWQNLLIVLQKGYDLRCWIAPIPEEQKEKMIIHAKEYLSKKPSLDEDESELGFF